jgi:hypothetical protein
MRKYVFMLLFCFVSSVACAQCSLCTRTAQQLGEKPAQGLNGGILYLMAIPFAILGIIGYKWWSAEKKQ